MRHPFFDLPPFIQGALRAFDLFGALPSEMDEILARSDAEAIAGDWKAVGRDLERAMRGAPSEPKAGKP